MASVAAEADAAAPTEAGKSRVALVLAVAAILTAGLGTRAELLASSAGDDWHASGTLDAKRMTAMLNDASLVYLGDAPAGVETLRARVRAESLQAAAAQQLDPTIADSLSGQALVESELAKATAHGGPLAEEALRSGTFDVGRRLAAKRAESPELVAIDPDADFRAANDAAHKSTLVLLAAIPAALAFAAGSLAQALPRRRRLLLALALALLAITVAAVSAVEVLA